MRGVCHKKWDNLVENLNPYVTDVIVIKKVFLHL